MPTLTVTSKGQVSLRRDVLEHLGIGPATTSRSTNLLTVEAKAERLTGKISEIFGMVWRPDAAVRLARSAGQSARLL